MKVIYIAGKYTGKTHGPESYAEIGKNILTAREWTLKVLALGNCITLTPHLNSAHMEVDCPKPAQFWYEGDLELMYRCDAVFMIPNWTDSKGAKMERDEAIQKGLPVFENLEDLKIFLGVPRVTSY